MEASKKVYTLNHATIRENKLSDGSTTFDVVYRAADPRIGFLEIGCKDFASAVSLADELNDACWVQLA